CGPRQTKRVRLRRPCRAPNRPGLPRAYRDERTGGTRRADPPERAKGCLTNRDDARGGGTTSGHAVAGGRDRVRGARRLDGTRGDGDLSPQGAPGDAAERRDADRTTGGPVVGLCRDICREGCRGG